MTGRGKRHPANFGRGSGAKTALWVGLGVLAVGLVGLIWWRVGLRGDRSSAQTERLVAPAAKDSAPSSFQLEAEQEVFAQYGGSASCRECHEEAYALWERSNHGLAERPVRAEVDRMAFDPARSFHHGSQSTTVQWVDDRAEVKVLGLSGEPELHRPDRVIGNHPLRQFLVPFPGGRWQTLEASYDPVTNEWFNVYGEEDRQPGEWGHWTGRGMNWNHMCASCHNTRLRKNYDPASDSYSTTMAEMTVGCEACHGPLKAHNEWQRAHGRSGLKDPTLPPSSRRLALDTCGFCHARRSDLTGDFKPGDWFLDHHDLTIVDRTDIYYADGQVRDEDYEYASFLSSRMHLRGVVCMDCHDPHSMKTRLPGNWLCIRCHNGSYTNAPVIDPVAHSRHKVFGFSTNGVPEAFDLLAYDPRQIKETGGECVNCHMPQTVYMQRHWRHDHGFTIPDPQLTREFGIPNACNRCHLDKSVEWAIEYCEQWYSNRMDRVTRHRTRTLARARQNDPASREPLLKMVREEELGYWRAAAVEHLEPWIADPAVSTTLLRATQDEDPLVRTKAVSMVAPLLSTPSGTAVRRVLEPLLKDPLRAVRVRAAWALRDNLDLGSLAASELLHSLVLNADQPGGRMQLGAWALSRGSPEEALSHYQRAAGWDPNSAPIRHDYAVVLSQLGRAGEAVAQLQAACRLMPAEAEFQYKLGLALHETGDLQGTISALRTAVQLSPNHARAAYNLGLALNRLNRVGEALEALQRAESADPTDARIPYAMATILANDGRIHDARAAVERSLELAPTWEEALRLQEALR